MDGMVEPSGWPRGRTSSNRGERLTNSMTCDETDGAGELKGEPGGEVRETLVTVILAA
jgi:hypothetical protein